MIESLAEVFEEPPVGFNPEIQAAGCFIEAEGRLLYLKRASSRPWGNTWCIPGGKIEAEETPLLGVIRETWEETGIKINAAELESIGKLYIRLGGRDSIFHMFYHPFATAPVPTLNGEHTDFQWISPIEAASFPLIPGGKAALNYFLRVLNSVKKI